MVLFAVTRIPGLMPWNFSAAYALMFCAGVFFPRKLVWWLPFATMLVTDILLNSLYYKLPASQWFSPQMLAVYGIYVVLVWMGRKFGPKASFMSLLGGGILGALLFYVITNSISWLDNPEYKKTLTGWLVALTKGTSGWPQTWEFFRNTLMSGGLFTGLFAGAMKLLEALEPAEEEEKEKAEEEAPEAKPEEAKA